MDNTPGVFDDGSHHSFDVWGVYGSRVSMKSLAESPEITIITSAQRGPSGRPGAPSTTAADII